MNIPIELPYKAPSIKKPKFDETGQKITARSKHKSSLSCPKCGHPKTGTLHSYGMLTELIVVRRRKCYNWDCQFRFTTYERIEINSELVVVKRDRKREPFDREKLTKSLRLALSKRNIAEERLARIVNGIILSLDVQQQKDQMIIDKPSPAPKKGLKKQYIPVPSSHLGELCLASLKELDAVSYLRYASIFHRFHSIGDYESAIEDLAQ